MRRHRRIDVDTTLFWRRFPAGLSLFSMCQIGYTCIHINYVPLMKTVLNWLSFYVSWSNLHKMLTSWLKTMPHTWVSTRWHVRPMKTLIRLHIGAVWSVSSIGTLSVAKGPMFFRWKTKTLIRLCGCADWFEFSLYSHASLCLMLDTGSCLFKMH